MTIRDPEGMNLEKGVNEQGIEGPSTPVETPVDEAPADPKD